MLPGFVVGLEVETRSSQRYAKLWQKQHGPVSVGLECPWSVARGCLQRLGDLDVLIAPETLS